jgi:two-component system, sensor histidine kinase and response regulator
MAQPSPTLRRVRSSAQRMTGIIDQLYEVARARLGDGIRIEPRAVDLAAIVHDVVREQGLARADHAVELTVRGDATGRWDAVQLARAASNLIGNALTHGAREAAVRVTVDGGDPRRVEVEVWNAGAIPAEVVARVFQPFARGPGSTRGLGLGLFIVQQIVAAHGGQLTFDTSAERGTAFRFALPRGPAHPAQ